MFSISSNGSRASRSILLMKVKIGMWRSAQTLNSLLVCGLDALGAVNDHDGGVRRHQGAVGILGEVLMAGRVQNVDAVALIAETA